MIGDDLAPSIFELVGNSIRIKDANILAADTADSYKVSRKNDKFHDRLGKTYAQNLYKFFLWALNWLKIFESWEMEFFIHSMHTDTHHWPRYLLLVIRSVSDVLWAQSRLLKFVGGEAAGRTPYTFYKPTLGLKYVRNRPYNEFITPSTVI